MPCQQAECPADAAVVCSVCHNTELRGQRRAFAKERGVFGASIRRTHPAAEEGKASQPSESSEALPVLRNRARLWRAGFHSTPLRPALPCWGAGGLSWFSSVYEGAGSGQEGLGQTGLATHGDSDYIPWASPDLAILPADRYRTPAVGRVCARHRGPSGAPRKPHGNSTGAPNGQALCAADDHILILNTARGRVRGAEGGMLASLSFQVRKAVCSGSQVPGVTGHRSKSKSEALPQGAGRSRGGAGKLPRPGR